MSMWPFGPTTTCMNLDRLNIPLGILDVHRGRWRFLCSTPALIDIFQVPDNYDVDRVVEVFAKHTSKGDKKLEFRVIRLINQHDQDELPDYSTNWYFTPWNRKTTMRMQKQGPTKLLGTTPDMDYAGTINGPFEQLHANPDTPVIFIIPAWPEFKEIRYMQLRTTRRSVTTIRCGNSQRTAFRPLTKRPLLSTRVVTL